MKKSETTKPRTIADLKFNWEITPETHDDLISAQDKIKSLNPHLIRFKIVPGIYHFYLHYGTHEVTVESDRCSLHNLIEFFEYLCWKLNMTIETKITGKFSHFERIDDQTYRIHMKS